MRLSKITWPAAERYFKENDMVILPIGSTECHGRHMPLGTDTLIPDKILDLIEEKNDNILIAPMIPYGACQSNWWLMAWDMKPEWKGGHGGGEETAGVMAVDPSLIDMSQIDLPLEMANITDNLVATGFRTVHFKGVEIEVLRNTPKVTDNGWIGPDHPNTATPEWGQEMVQTTADYIVDLVEELKKVKL